MLIKYLFLLLIYKGCNRTEIMDKIRPLIFLSLCLFYFITRSEAQIIEHYRTQDTVVLSIDFGRLPDGLSHNEYAGILDALVMEDFPYANVKFWKPPVEVPDTHGSIYSNGYHIVVYIACGYEYGTILSIGYTLGSTMAFYVQKQLAY